MFIEGNAEFKLAKASKLKTPFLLQKYESNTMWRQIFSMHEFQMTERETWKSLKGLRAVYPLTVPTAAH